jgi:hypothetical protein
VGDGWGGRGKLAVRTQRRRGGCIDTSGAELGHGVGHLDSCCGVDLVGSLGW